MDLRKVMIFTVMVLIIRACCRAKQGFAIINLEVVGIDKLPSSFTKVKSSALADTSETGTLTTPTTSASNSTTATPTSSGAFIPTSATSSSTDNLSTGSKIAIRVSVGVAGILIGLGIAFLVFRYRKKKRAKSAVTPIPELPNRSVAEKEGDHDMGELGTSGNKPNPNGLRAELRGRNDDAELRESPNIPLEMSSANYSLELP